MRQLYESKKDKQEINLRFAGEILLMIVSVYFLGLIPLVLAFSFIVPRRHKLFYAILIIIKVAVLVLVMEAKFKSMLLV